MNADDFGRFAESLRDESNYERLFGTPERAARTLGVYFIEDCSGVKCGDCPFYGEGDYLNCIIARRNDDALLEWLRGDAE